MNFLPYNIHMNYSNITSLTLDDIRAIAAQLGGERRCGSRYMCRCPAHNGCDSNLSISLGDNGKLLMFCFSHRCEFEDILKAIQGKGLLPSSGCVRYCSSKNAIIRTPNKPKKDSSFVNKIWKECLFAKGSVVETYLKGRGYTEGIPNTLRYHSNLYHKVTESHYSAMVGAVTRWPGSDVIGIHRTYLKPDGSGKADIIPNKMMLGTTSGGTVRLAGAGSKLIVAEGIETSLSIYLATRIPTWATLSTSGMLNVIVPSLDITQEIIIAADNDTAGIRSANELADRLLKNDYRVSIIMPPADMDFNDLLGV